MRKTLSIIITIVYCILGIGVVSGFAFAGVNTVNSGLLAGAFGVAAAWTVISAFWLWAMSVSKSMVKLIAGTYCVLGLISAGALLLAGLTQSNSGNLGGALGVLVAWGIGAGFAIANSDDISTDLS